MSKKQRKKGKVNRRKHDNKNDKKGIEVNELPFAKIFSKAGKNKLSRSESCV